MAMKKLLEGAHRNYIAKKVVKITDMRRERKVRVVQMHIKQNFLSRVNEFKARRCLRMVQATSVSVYTFKDRVYKYKAKEVVAKMFKSMNRAVQVKNSCLVYVIKIKTILNRFKNSRNVKLQYMKKLKPVIDKQIVRMTEYDGFLPSKERIEFSKKLFYYYKHEDQFLEFMVDISKIQLLMEIYNGDEHFFNGRRLLHKYYLRFPLMTNVWKKYAKPNAEYEDYIRRYPEFMELLTEEKRNRLSLFKTEVRDNDRRYSKERETITLSLFVQNNRIMVQLMTIDFMRLIFEFVMFKGGSSTSN